MKEFIKKYGLIVFLVVMIVILAFVKIFFNNKSNENEINNNSIENNSSINKNTNPIDINQSVSITPVVNEEETFENLSDKYESFETVEERENWFDNLSSEEKKILSGEDVVEVSQLNNELPYEGSTFVVNNVFSNNLIMAKSKIDDLEKAEADLREWLSSKEMNFEDLVITWE